MPLIVLSALFYVAAEVLGFKLIGAFSLLPCVAGIVLLVGGWSMIRWSWPAIVFLGFMIPLPVALENAATYPLRRTRDDCQHVHPSDVVAFRPSPTGT